MSVHCLLGWSGISSFLFRTKSKIFDHDIGCLIQINTWSRVSANLDMNLFELEGHQKFAWTFFQTNVQAYHVIGLNTQTSMVSIFPNKIKASDFRQYSSITFRILYKEKACNGSVFRPEICRRFPYKVQQQILLSHRKVIGAIQF